MTRRLRVLFISGQCYWDHFHVPVIKFIDAFIKVHCTYLGRVNIITHPAVHFMTFLEIGFKKSNPVLFYLLVFAEYFRKYKTCWHSCSFALKIHHERNLNIHRWPFRNSRLTIKKWTQALGVTPTIVKSNHFCHWMDFMDVFYGRKGLGLQQRQQLQTAQATETY